MNQPNPGQGGNVQPDGNSGHPAWQEYLKDVPASLHPVVQSAFQAWDNNVQARMQQIHEQYAPLKAYQPLLENKIPLEYVGQALQFAQQLESDPKEMVTRINKQMNLGFVPEEEVQRQAPNSSDDPFDNFGADANIEDHPAFKKVVEALGEMQARFNEQEQESQSEQEFNEFNAYLDSLTENTPFKDNEDARTLITAFMSQGIEGPEALKKVQSNFVQSLSGQAEDILNNGEQSTSTGDPLRDAINSQLGAPPDVNALVGYVPQANDQAPVVMGNSGNAGSGVPANPIDFGTMKSDDINALVAQTLQNIQDS